MSTLTLNTPEQLTRVIEHLVMTASEKRDLNRRMANRARQFFRQQIRAQRDIDNNPYQTRRARSKTSSAQGRHTVNNKNMLMGLSKSLRTYADETSFEVGLKGVAGFIGRTHNDGENVSFTTHVNGFYDSRIGRWTGGRVTKRNYTMPRRTFLGWTPVLEKELMAMAAAHFAREDIA